MPQLRARAREAVLGALGFSVGALLLLCTVSLAQQVVVPPAADQDAPRSPAQWPKAIASYELTARLDAERHRITGSGTMHFRNASRVAVSELYLHLYLNAFENDQTLFQRSAFQRGRSGERTRSPGHIDVEKLIAVEFDNRDLWPQADQHTPGDEQDRTDIRVPLPRPLQPGERLTLQVSWNSVLPEISERSGFKRDFHMVAQWFPKLARLEPDGQWAHFAFHPQSEFYADFGDYDVTLDVPLDHEVGASGQLVKQETEGARKRLTFRAQAVHDFAWTSWPGFLRHDELIEGVHVSVLYPAAAQPLLSREIDTVRWALPAFNQAYGRYPYPTLTLVHPPAYASAAGGMEYPTLITTGGNVLTNWFSRAVEMVTLHELGHQWFYGLVATNEHRWPFLDEGLNSYAESLLMQDRFGHGSGGGLWDLQLSVTAVQRAHAASAEHDQAIAAAASEFSSFGSLGALVYARTATVLHSLAGAFGQQPVAQALALYTHRYRFKHPSADDFFLTMQQELGEPAGAALRGLLEQPGWLDYELSELRSERDDAATPEQKWVGQVVVRRHGSVSLPVEIELIAADGSRTRHHWDGGSPWLKLDYRGSSQLVAAMVDPDLALPIDSNLLNNARAMSPAPGYRTLERSVYLFAQLFGGLAW